MKVGEQMEAIKALHMIVHGFVHYKNQKNFSDILKVSFKNTIDKIVKSETIHNLMVNINEIDQEAEIIKYALTYLLSNLDDDIVEDMSEYVGTDDFDEVQAILYGIIDK